MKYLKTISRCQPRHTPGFGSCPTPDPRPPLQISGLPLLCYADEIIRLPVSGSVNRSVFIKPINKGRTNTQIKSVNKRTDKNNKTDLIGDAFTARNAVRRQEVRWRGNSELTSRLGHSGSYNLMPIL